MAPFALGAMSLTWMIVVSALIAARKLLAWRRAATTRGRGDPGGAGDRRRRNARLSARPDVAGHPRGHARDAFDADALEGRALDLDELRLHALDLDALTLAI
jgi:hypothetical protein